jgi:HIT domain
LTDAIAKNGDSYVTGSPFLDVDPSRWVGSNELAFALRDSYPVTRGHTLVIPKRLVVTWFEATHDEQIAVLSLVDEVKKDLDREFRPDGFNVGTTEIAVRSPVNVIKRDTLGLPVLALAGLLAWMPPRLADALSWPLMRLTVGDITKLGLRKLPYGPMQQVIRTKRIPLVDIGTLALIRDGKIKVRTGVARMDGDEVIFDDDSRGRYDVVVLATGYRPGVAQFLDARETLGEDGVPTTSGVRTSLPGLYYCGFFVSPYGMLRAIAAEARAISQDIGRRSLPA